MALALAPEEAAAAAAAEEEEEEAAAPAADLTEAELLARAEREAATMEEAMAMMGAARRMRMTPALRMILRVPRPALGGQSQS